MMTPRKNFQVEIDPEYFEVEPEVSPSSETDSELFGLFQKLQTYSPFNCGAPHRIPRYIFRVLTLISILAMLFRFYWMTFEISEPFLTFGWAESTMYGFQTLESLIVTIALLRITSNHSLKRFERNLKSLKMLRCSKKVKSWDDYRVLKIRVFVGASFVLLSFILTSVWLVAHKLATFQNKSPSSWYWTYDPIVAILCGYSNFLFLPCHSLLHHAMSREFEVFNEELLEVSKDRKLISSLTLRTFAYRQQKLFEFTNFMTKRIDRLMVSAPFFALLSFLMATYLISEYSKTPPTLYLICIIAQAISLFIINFALMHPVARVQRSMLNTSHILMDDAGIQNSNDPVVHQTYRIMMDRALFHRRSNKVLRLFSVNLTNIERIFAFHSLAIVVMSVTNGFQEGLQEGFGGIGSALEKMTQGAHS